jgi:hypothetical protein
MYIDFLHGLCKMVQSGLDRSETADIGPKLSGPKTRPAVRSSTFMRPQTRPTADQTKDRSGDRSQTGPPDPYVHPTKIFIRNLSLLASMTSPLPTSGNAESGQKAQCKDTPGSHSTHVDVTHRTLTRQHNITKLFIS